MATLPTDIIEADVASIFLSYFKRAPEFEAMEWYAQVYVDLLAEQGDNPAGVENAFKALSAQIYADGTGAGEVPAGPTVTNAWYVDYLYQNILGRQADPDGRNYWIDQLDTGAIDRPELVGILIASAMEGGGRDAAYVGNRTYVAVQFAQWENSNPQILPDLRYDAAEVLLGVNETEASVAAAEAKLNQSTGDIGETFQLTPGIDTFEGTVRDDTFNAFWIEPPGGGDNQSTLTPFDSIDGDTGWDVMNIFTDGTANPWVPGTASVQNVEVVNIFYDGMFTDPLPDGARALADASVYQGVRQLWQIDGAMDVTELGPNTIAGFDGLMIGEASAPILIDTTDAATEANLAVTGFQGADAVFDVFGESLNTVNVIGNLGSTREMELILTLGDGETSATVNTEVQTDLFLHSYDHDNSIAMLDASGSTGGVVLITDWSDLVGPGQAFTALFGSGDDVIKFDVTERGMTLQDVIDGGDGIDTAAFNFTGSLQTQDYDTINRLQNFEVVAFTGGSVTVDAAELAGFNLAFGGETHFGEDPPDAHVIIENLTNDTLVTFFNEVDDDWNVPGPASATLLDAGADVAILVESDTTGEDQYVLELIAEHAPGDASGGMLDLWGNGGVIFDNTTGKFAIIEATFMGDGMAAGGLGLDLTGMATHVAEQVFLSDDTWDEIHLEVDATDGERNSSTIANMDRIFGFDSGEDSDELISNVAFSEYLNDMAGWGEVATLQQAWAFAANQAESADDGMYFHFEGDTYFYADTVDPGEGRYDNGDFALMLEGIHNLEWGPIVL